MITIFCDVCRRHVPLSETRGLGELELGFDVLTQCLDRPTCEATEAAYVAAERAKPRSLPVLPDDVPF
ncbi:MAG TPA: hypothetical protein VN238_17700 [Solirubrobacteraceae bacterium]|nr:hypothetical protein [Solirubrobacteraceae bacterium]